MSADRDELARIIATKAKCCVTCINEVQHYVLKNTAEIADAILSAGFAKARWEPISATSKRLQWAELCALRRSRSWTIGNLPRLRRGFADLAPSMTHHKGLEQRVAWIDRPMAVENSRILLWMFVVALMVAAVGGVTVALIEIGALRTFLWSA